MNPNCDVCLTVNNKVNINFCYCGADEILDGTRSKCEKYIYLDGEWIDPKGKYDGKHDDYKSYKARKAEINLSLNYWRLKYGAEYPKKKTIKFNIIKRVNCDCENDEPPPPYSE